MVEPMIGAIVPSLAIACSGLVRVELDAERVGDLGQERPHGVGHDDREPVPADPGHRLGQRGHRVVVVDHRAVPGPAGRVQAQPGQALLGRLDQVQPQVLGDRVRRTRRPRRSPRCTPRTGPGGCPPASARRTRRRPPRRPGTRAPGRAAAPGPRAASRARWPAASRRSPSCRPRRGPRRSRRAPRRRTGAPTTRRRRPAPRRGDRVRAARPARPYRPGRRRRGRPRWPGPGRSRR